MPEAAKPPPSASGAGDLLAGAGESTSEPTPLSQDAPTGRFLTIPQVAAELATSPVQIRSLLNQRELLGIQIGGRGQWRIERVQLEAFIERRYQAAHHRDGHQ